MNENSLIVDKGYCGHPHGNRMDTPSPKFGSDLKTDDATYAPRGYENIYDSQNETFWREQAASQADLEWLERTGKGDWLAFMMVSG